MKIIKIAKKDKIASFIVFKKEKILVLKRSKKSKNNANKWNLPGGHIDKGETPKEAAIRECQEEAGITPKKVEFFGTYGKMEVYIGETKETPIINEESDEWRFISKKEIKSLDFVDNAVIVLKRAFKERVN